tara:strand:- start:621 stop:1427 length:807 start_codon:yes stop_codon:yes gene_type:complete
MARPQLEDGHTRIANEVLDHLVQTYIAPNQWQVLLFILRKTYGYGKRIDWITNSQIVDATGLVKSTISRALKVLEERRIIVRDKKCIGFQKDWEQWLAVQLTPNKEKLAIPKQKLAIQSTKVSSPLVTQKKKETIQKKYTYLFTLWNGLGIFRHKKLSRDMKLAIKSACRDYTETEIEQAISNYAHIVLSSDFYFSHRWTLSEFLSRRQGNNIERFLDLEVAKANFKKERSSSGTHRQGSTGLINRDRYTQPPNDPHLRARSSEEDEA